MGGDNGCGGEFLAARCGEWQVGLNGGLAQKALWLVEWMVSLVLFRVFELPGTSRIISMLESVT